MPAIRRGDFGGGGGALGLPQLLLLLPLRRGQLGLCGLLGCDLGRDTLAGALYVCLHLCHEISVLRIRLHKFRNIRWIPKHESQFQSDAGLKMLTFKLVDPSPEPGQLGAVVVVVFVTHTVAPLKLSASGRRGSSAVSCRGWRGGERGLGGAAHLVVRVVSIVGMPVLNDPNL